MGAAAVDLAYVASGRLDGFWELHLSPWDVAGGAALIRAAGGRVTDQRGGEDDGKHVAQDLCQLGHAEFTCSPGAVTQL